MNLNSVLVTWRDPAQEKWYPVGRLERIGEDFRFSYVEGALDAQQTSGFQGLASFPDLHDVYESDVLFPTFQNRLLTPLRPDYKHFTQWLNVPEDEKDPLILLARSGGRKETDTLGIVPIPETDQDGRCHLHFFAHGLGHFPEASRHRLLELNPKAPLLLCHDFQNPVDRCALMLRTSDQKGAERYLVGWCPRYLFDGVLFQHVLSKPESIRVWVERINHPPAPLRLRLLCAADLRCPADYAFFSDRRFRPVANVGVNVLP